MAAELTFGSWLKRRRQGLGFTQKELARRIGYAEVSVRKVEADERQPSREMAEKLAEHLDIGLEDRERFIRFARDEAGWAEFSLPTQTVSVADSSSPSATADADEPESSPPPIPRFLSQDAEATEAAPSVFVAREKQLDRLEAFLDAALAGRGQIAFITGEAGSGKSTLIRAFARRAQQRHPDLIVAAGTCHVYTGVGDPYLPFREVMAMLSGDVEAQWASGAITRDHALRLWRLLPQVVDVLVARGPDLLGAFVSRQDLAARAVAHDSQRTAWRERLHALLAHERSQGPDGVNYARSEQSRLFEEYADVLQTLTTQQPLLLLLDDLHWADVSSIGLLFHLARCIGESRILIVGAYRPEEVALGLPDGPHPLDSVVSEIKRLYGDILVNLDQEEESEGRRFVSDLLDLEFNRLDETFRQALFRHGRGHPLFTVELLRDLQDRGVLTHDEQGRWVIGADLAWDTVPARVEGVIEKRVGRLDSRLREVLAVASVAGETFTGEVVARVLAADTRQIVNWLSRDLQKHHRLVRVEGVRYLGSQRLSLYRFGHHLFQKYMYQSLDGVERAHLHEAVGAALEQLYQDQNEFVTFAGALARHFEEAGMVDKAIHYRLMAGRHAGQMSAHQEAIVHLTQGLALIEKIPDTPERRRRELSLQLALAVPVTTTRGYANPDAYQVYAQAQMLARQVGEVPDVFQALYGLWRFALIYAELDEAQALGQQLMELAQDTQDTGLLVEAHRAMGVNFFHLGNFTAARTVLEQGIALYDPEQHRTHAFLYGHDPAVSCLAYLAHTLWMLGYPEQARTRLQDLLRLAWNLAHPFSLAYSQSYGAAVGYQLLRDVQAVREWAERGLALATRRGFPFWIASATILRGWALSEHEAVVEGIVQMKRGMDAWQATGARTFFPYFVCLLAEAYARTEQTERGLAAVAGGLDAVESTNERFYEAELYRLRGELLLLQDAPNAAEDAFKRALEVAQQQQARSLELRAVTSLSQYLIEQGKEEEARRYSMEAYKKKDSSTNST